MTKQEWNRQNNDAIAILHRAWFQVSGGGYDARTDKASVTLAHAKNYLLLQTWGSVG